MAQRKKLATLNALRNCMAQTPALAANTGRKQATVAMERATAMQPAQSELGRAEAFHRGSNQKRSTLFVPGAVSDGLNRSGTQRCPVQHLVLNAPGPRLDGFRKNPSGRRTLRGIVRQFQFPECTDLRSRVKRRACFWHASINAHIDFVDQIRVRFEILEFCHLEDSGPG